jgi:hypothetical protein
LGLALGFGLSYLFFVQSFSLQSPKLDAVALQQLNEITLRLDGGALLDNEQGHEAVGSDEDNGQ